MGLLRKLCVSLFKLFDYILSQYQAKINPNSPHNFASIDKRIPINQVRFVGELKQHDDPTHDLPLDSEAV